VAIQLFSTFLESIHKTFIVKESSFGHQGWLSCALQFAVFLPAWWVDRHWVKLQNCIVPMGCFFSKPPKPKTVVICGLSPACFSLPVN
jgi:hypothetical protein